MTARREFISAVCTILAYLLNPFRRKTPPAEIPPRMLAEVPPAEPVDSYAAIARELLDDLPNKPFTQQFHQQFRRGEVDTLQLQQLFRAMLAARNLRGELAGVTATRQYRSPVIVKDVDLLRNYPDLLTQAMVQVVRSLYFRCFANSNLVVCEVSTYVRREAYMLEMYGWVTFGERPVLMRGNAEDA